MLMPQDVSRNLAVDVNTASLREIRAVLLFKQAMSRYCD